MASPDAALKIQPVILDGTYIRLEPLAEERHGAELCEIGLDPDLWRLVPYQVSTREEMIAYVRQALAAQATGMALPFALVEKATGAVVGSTRYMNIDAANRRLEIGSTWIARPWRARRSIRKRSTCCCATRSIRCTAFAWS